MKRKSTLILIAALVLAITIPVFALAENTTGVQVLDGSGNMFGRGASNAVASDETVTQGARLMAQDCDLTDEDCDCDAEGIGLGNDGEAQHLYARSESGQSTQVGAGMNRGSRFSSTQNRERSPVRPRRPLETRKDRTSRSPHTTKVRSKIGSGFCFAMVYFASLTGIISSQ